jgi:16S rRNA (cytidine1402-2'-O)-methyltransferase
VVATPIGNAEDITLRALTVLREVDEVACEDSRVTAKLLARHGVGAKLTPYHEHNAARARPRLIAKLSAGGRIALVSDAGTPLVSDPGYKLVRACIEAGVPVIPVPGPSAPLTALLVSGLPSDRFLFAGFLPNKSTARRRVFGELAAVPATLLFFESAQRLAESLADMAEVLGDRPSAVARELTKLFEECRRGSLAELAAHYRASGPPKGEIVIVCGGATGEDAAAAAETLDSQLATALKQMSLKDAVAAVATATGLPRKQVYGRALQLAADDKPGGDKPGSGP